MKKILKYLKSNINYTRAFLPIFIPKIISLELFICKFYYGTWLMIDFNLIGIDILTPWNIINYTLKGSLLKLNLKVMNFVGETEIEIDVFYNLFYYICYEDEEQPGKYLTNLKLAWFNIYSNL